MSRVINEESFVKDVSKHEMTVLKNEGVYRHLRFKNPNSGNQWFDIVTWPGHLAYTGDMGSFVFARLQDMFQFFRTDRRDETHLGINPSYWAEKLQAVDAADICPGGTEFSAERLRAHVEETLAEWGGEDYNLSEDEAHELRGQVELDVLDAIYEDEGSSRRAVSEFSFEIGGNIFEFTDSWEWNCHEHTLRFMWCCYALAWAIQQYDASHDKGPVTA